jgi:membrane protein YqaA with SNARE-associated domain
MDLTELAAFGSLALAAFGAATLLPFQSEIVFVGLIAAGTVGVTEAVVVASVFNTLGSVVNWVMGLFIEHWRDSRWFPVTPEQLEKAQHWYERWGVWTLLLSWAPFGDGFTVIAGIMRTPLWLFTLLVGAVKTLRYLVLAGVMDGLP